MADLWKPQTENLFRGLVGGVTLRAGPDGDMGDDASEVDGDGTAEASNTTISGHFAVFNEWTEICSWYEGEFIERLLPGSFTKTMGEKSARKVCQFDHGYDEFVGSALLGPIDVLQEDKIGAYYEVPLLDTDYNRDRVLPLCQGRLMDGTMRGSLLGASFRFSVIKDMWDMEPKVSAYNPKGLPERSVMEVRLFEFGPVVFPAYPTATAEASAGPRMRSLSDHYLDRVRSKRSTQFAGAATGTPTVITPGNNVEPVRHSEVAPPSLARVRARLALADI